MSAASTLYPGLPSGEPDTSIASEPAEPAAPAEKPAQPAPAEPQSTEEQQPEAAAASGADIVVTDTWVSMGQDHAHNKLAAMAPYQVNDRLMKCAKPDARFLHCLPAHIGEEVSESVFEGPQSVVFDEAENRIHAQKSILRWVFGQL